MMDHLPDHVDFGPYRAKITLAPASDPDGENHGEYLFLQHPEIRIDSWGDKESASILLHEIIHFMSDCAGLDLEEPAVRHLEFCFASLLMANPQLVLALMRGLTTSPNRHVPQSD